MKQLRFIFMLIFISFFMFSCQKQENNNEDEKPIIDTTDYISDISYKVIDYDMYNTRRKENIIKEADYEDLLLGNKVLLVIEYKVYGINNKSNEEMYTLKIEYEGMDLDLYDSNTSSFSNIKNVLRLDYSYVDSNTIKDERIELVIDVINNGYIDIKFDDKSIFNISFNDISPFEFKKINDKELDIVCYKKTDSNITIPETVGSYSVSGIRENAFNGLTIDSFIIPSTIKSISEDAFNNCTFNNVNKYNEMSYLGNDDNKYLLLISVNYLEAKEYEINNNCKFFIGNPFGFFYSMNKVTMPKALEDKINLPSENRNGYSYKGWNKINNSNTVTYEVSYELIEYSITYNLDGGTNNSNNPSIYTVESENITINAPTKTGYSFDGWKANGNTSIEPSYFIRKGTIGNITLEAVWTLIKHSFKVYEGPNKTNITTLEVNDGYTYTLTNPKCDGYEFDGWFLDEEYNNKVLNSLTIYNDTILYSKWNIITYGISYELDGGTNNSNNPSTYTVEDEIEMLSPTKEGYTLMDGIII